MELPHLRLYLRRVLGAPRLPLRERLRTARLRALLVLLGWLIATVTMQWLQLGGPRVFYSPQAYIPWLEDAPGLFYILVTTIGLWSALFLAADEMSTLAQQGRFGTPDWYSSPLDTPPAVLGTLLAALCAAGPALLGLGLFVLLAGLWVEVHILPLRPFLAPALLQLLLGFPGYCLAAGALALGLRGHPLRPFLPLLLASAGLLLGLTQYALRLEPAHVTPPPTLNEVGWQTALDSPYYAGTVLAGLLSLVLLALLVASLARQADASLLGTALLFGLLGSAALPALRAGLDVYAQAHQGYWYFDDAEDSLALNREPAAVTLRYLAAAVWPTSFAKACRDDGANGYRHSAGRWQTMAIPLGRLLPGRLVQAALALKLWWWCCVAMLRCIRHPAGGG